ncbi:hypothetical protein WJ86_14625 [Burkholderia multivorans]|nr:hypothetical protein WJ86_14625 [Burkholderia multivorans]
MWAELRTAWSATEFKKNRPLTQQQRFVLEIVHVRRALRHMDRLVNAAEQELKKDGLAHKPEIRYRVYRRRSNCALPVNAS